MVSILKATNIEEILEKGQIALILFIKLSLFFAKIRKTLANGFLFFKSC
jgi:hypothetical protein